MSLTLRVRVIDESGAPVAGAVVRGDETNVATTDTDGMATLGGIDTGWHSVTVTHAMPAEAQLGLSLAEGSSGIIERTVTLRRGAPLGGTVVSPDGVPLAGAMLELWCADDRTLFLASDAAGAWLAPAMLPGPYEVRAGADGYARGRAIAGTHDGRTARLDVVVSTAIGARLHGCVRDTAGRAVAGASVYTEMHPGDDRSATTDADGCFDIPGLGAGRHYVSVARGRWRTSVVMPGDGQQLELDVELPDPEAAQSPTSCCPREAEPTAEPSATATLTGRVLRDGVPVSQFAIVRTGMAAYNWITRPAMIYAPDGRFTLSDLREPSCSVHVLAVGTAWTDVATVELTPGSTTDLGDISLVPGTRIVGTVRDATGSPVSGATVTIGSRAHNDNDALGDAVEGYFATTSDADGAFALDGVHVRERHVRISAHHPVHGASLEQQIAAGDEAFHLVLLATGAIDGEVEDTAMHGGVIVRGDGPGMGSHMGRLRPSGTFAIDGLLPGDYTIELLERPSWPRREARVTVVAGQRARVRIPPPGC